MVGDNTTKKFPLHLFEPKFIAGHGSYRPTISEFWEKKRIRFVTENDQYELPNIIVLIFGGNDIAFLQTPEYRSRGGCYFGNFIKSYRPPSIKLLIPSSESTHWG